MEEIDNIIIDSLRNLQCNISEEIKSLKDFDADIIVEAVSTCLQAINPGTAYSKKLPPSMSLKLKIASNLAEQIKEAGFQGDMGYQTILYCNEVEIRRVLMFLIERLPRDVHKVPQVEETGYVQKTVKEIELCIRRSMEQMWLPTSILNRGARTVGNSLIVNSLGGSVPLKSRHLQTAPVETSESVDEEALRHYWIHIAPEVTKQCSLPELIPSLLFKDIKFEKNYFKSVLKEPMESSLSNNVSTDQTILNKATFVQSKDELSDDNSSLALEVQHLVTSVEAEKQKYLSLKEVIRSSDLESSQLKTMLKQEEDALRGTLADIKIKTKTLAVASKEENKLKLKSLIESSNERLVELAKQWSEVQTPLLEEYKTLQNSLSSEELKLHQDQARLHALKETCTNLIADLKEKEILEESLIEKCQQINKTNNRSAYTRRILEIIGNIKKQDLEIQKVLRDTREVQKDINNLSGQVDRSFTLADEMIFRDAKHSEVARKAYKLLAALRTECSDIIKAVTDMGLTEREIRNLQDQIDMESAKEMSKKLERVLKDLEEVGKETAMLIVQKKQAA